MTQAAAATAAPAPSSSPVSTAAPKIPDSPQPAANLAAAADFKSSKHKIKEDGVEREVDYDELVRGYQKASVSDKRYQEAARLHQEAQTVNKALEDGDVSYLVKKMGPQKARAMMENYLIEQMQYDNLPDHEKELRTERQKRAALEAQIKQSEQSGEKQRYEALADQAFRDLDTEMGDALKAVGKQPNPRLALRMLEQIEARLKTKEEKIPATKAWELARQGLKEDIALIAPDLTPEDVVELFGKEFVEKLMKHKVEQVQGKSVVRRPKAEAVPKDTKPMTIDEKFAAIENKFKRR